MLQSSFNEGKDHSGMGDWGSVHIYKNGYLLAGDASHANNNRESDNLIELGGGGGLLWSKNLTCVLTLARGTVRDAYRPPAHTDVRASGIKRRRATSAPPDLDIFILRGAARHGSLT